MKSRVTRVGLKAETSTQQGIATKSSGEASLAANNPVFFVIRSALASIKLTIVFVIQGLGPHLYQNQFFLVCSMISLEFVTAGVDVLG